MSFKSIRRLFTSNICLNKLNYRLFSSYESEKPNDLKDLYRNPKIKKVVSMLSEYDFNGNQMNCIFNKIGKYIIEEKDLNADLMRDTIECWLSNLRPSRLRPNQLDKFNAEDIDYDLTVDFNHVVSKIEPKLLLMKSNAIEFRFNALTQLGIIDGKRDLWRMFVFSPNGYYLQSWTDVLKKYHYFDFRVLVWLLDKRDKNKLHPHPLIRNAKVMELPFHTIQCRFLFAQRTGLKTVSIINKLSNVENINRIDLRDIFLTPIEKYLKLIAPNITTEEYYAFESLLNESPIEEDEQIIQDLVELHSVENKKFKNSLSKEKQENLENNFQIISSID